MPRLKLTNEQFIQKAREIHGNKYSYSLVEYIHSKDKVKIVCPIHGVWEQTPSMHLKGQGCKSCADIVRSETSGWSRTSFKEKCIKNNNSKGILYILECFDDTETFIKIGITSRSIKQRYRGTRDMPYEYTILHEIVGSPEFIYDLETLLHKKSKNYKYTPITQFAGSSTECFEADLTYLSKLNDYLDFNKEEGVS